MTDNQTTSWFCIRLNLDAGSARSAPLEDHQKVQKVHQLGLSLDQPSNYNLQLSTQQPEFRSSLYLNKTLQERV